MAGLGFKDFAVGEVLTAADVDGYLMQQTVMRFADAAARGSALGTATGTAVPLAEGMVSYLDDANYMQVFDGTKWRDGSIGIGTNIVQTVKTDVFTTTSTTFTAVTGVSATITPSTSTSKVLVAVSMVGSTTSGTVNSTGVGRLLRDSTAIGLGASSGSRSPSTFGFSTRETGTAMMTQPTFLFLDSPATTSATTYSVEVRVGAGTLFIGRSENDVDQANYGRYPSIITLIEVAA